MTLYDEALFLLKQLYSENAIFKSGQYEAIEAVVSKRRTLVVQKTGWGKSLVYFLATKLLKKTNNGVTIVVSPLLALMENQNTAAKKLNLKTEMLNSSVTNKEEVLKLLDTNQLDLLLITPETLFSFDIQKRFSDLNIMCFVIDEAHCISDWGHDFRLDYSRIDKIVSQLDKKIPILATTATANDRVINDLKNKLDENLHISRGDLTRDNISIDVIEFDGRAQRYAWLITNLNKFPGTGIIYCLTHNDCENLSVFLNENNYKTLPYYSGLENVEENLKKFENNEIKALVSTVKLGMGYDKDDVSFVIHYQQPNNLISYYQQIGRAGRSIEKSYALLMKDKNDIDILNSFIDNAFPKENLMYKIVDDLKEPKTLSELTKMNNVSLSMLKKVLMFLEKDNFIQKEKTKYYLTSNSYTYDKKYYNDIINQRKKELSDFEDFLSTKNCYSNYIVESLDGVINCICGVCSNCLKGNILPFDDYEENLENSLKFLNNILIPISPKKQYPNRKKLPFLVEEGICLCRYNESGYGKLVKDINLNKEQLLQKSYSILKNIVNENNIEYITSYLIKDFVKELSKLLNLKFIDVIDYKENNKDMNNSIYQYENAVNSFDVKVDFLPKKIILVDEFINSGWTITAIAEKLYNNGVVAVYPYVLSTKAKW